MISIISFKNTIRYLTLNRERDYDNRTTDKIHSFEQRDIIR